MPAIYRLNSKTGRLSTAAFHEFQRLAEELQILLVLGGVRAVDLDPLLGRRQARRLKRHDVVAREVQFPRHGHGEAQSDAVAADAGEHPVADEIGVQALELSRADPRELEQYGVDLALARRRHQRATV